MDAGAGVHGTEAGQRIVSSAWAAPSACYGTAPATTIRTVAVPVAPCGSVTVSLAV